ncbi:MAG: hypothetical protein H7122_06845 [Chitinophagaceae bacterium]|nr:hypothetical protein [Chitinophagaceae bacterium]
MSFLIQDANDFLNINKELLDEMNRYYEERGEIQDEINDIDDKTMNQYHRLKTYILEKKMGLLSGNK